MSEDVIKITERQLYILKKLYNSGKRIKVHSVYRTQNGLANELGITRQALSNHLRKLRDIDFIRTGRGFIDLTDKALEALGETGAEAFVFIKIAPQHREKAYSIIKTLSPQKLFRVTGEVDLIAQVGRAKLDNFLKDVSSVEGVINTSAHVILETISE